MYVNYFLKEKKKQKDINLYDTFNNFIILPSYNSNNNKINSKENDVIEKEKDKDNEKNININNKENKNIILSVENKKKKKFKC